MWSIWSHYFGVLVRKSIVNKSNNKNVVQRKNHWKSKSSSVLSLHQCYYVVVLRIWKRRWSRYQMYWFVYAVLQNMLLSIKQVGDLIFTLIIIFWNICICNRIAIRFEKIDHYKAYGNRTHSVGFEDQSSTNKLTLIFLLLHKCWRYQHQWYSF